MRAHVMIVDDAIDQLQLMRAALRIVDPLIKVVTASSGDEALTALRGDLDSLPKVILLDVRMPQKSGHEVLSELKADPDLRRIPVCMLSSGDLKKDVCLSYERGASVYFKKPGGLDSLSGFLDSFRKIWFEYACHCVN